MALATYRAVYRLAARPYALSNVFGGAGRKQFATIHHPATAVKWVRLRHVWVAVESASAAALFMFDLIRLTDAIAAGGNPPIVPAADVASDPAAESTCLALPTTPGTEDASPLSTTEYNLGVTGAGTTQNPPPDLIWRDLLELIGIGNPIGFSNYEAERRVPQIRPKVAEGWAITGDASAAVTIKSFAIVEFSEE